VAFFDLEIDNLIINISYPLYYNIFRSIPQDIFGKFDKKNKPLKAFDGLLFFTSVKEPNKGEFYFFKKNKYYPPSIPYTQNLG